LTKIGGTTYTHTIGDSVSVRHPFTEFQEETSMALMHALVCLAVFSAEPAVGITKTGVVDGRVTPNSLVDPGHFPKVLPPDLNKSIELARDRVKRAEQQLDDNFIDRQAKQLLVHLTLTRVSVFTANRPSEDKDLLDRILPPDEVVITCDGMEELSADGKPIWKFVGNTRVCATKAMVMCHEVTIRRDHEHVHMAMSGGRDWSVDLNELQKTEKHPTHSEGSVLLLSNRNLSEPHSYESGMVFRSAQLRQKRHDGSFLINTNASPLPSHDD
jgi:hypothetical protein